MRTVCEGKRVLLLENDGWEFVERKKGKEAVAIIARTDDDRVILTEQFRRPVQAPVIDWPAGLVGDEEPGATPDSTARKELKEETGYECESVELLANGPTSPGITSEIVSLYRAVGVRRVGSGGGVGGEDIEVHAIPVSALADWLKKQNGAGKIVDLKVWSGLYFLYETL
ncbi:MAG TPA: NUDIX hydrolase [Thermoanaerobaculia bacterium]|nr:NUDIX hydrolase [Thermoanaerobaculia bacterium]